MHITSWACIHYSRSDNRAAVGYIKPHYKCIYLYTRWYIVLHKLLDLNISTCLNLKSLNNNFYAFFFTFIGSIIPANTSVAVQKNINDGNLNLVSARAKETTVFTTALWLADFDRVRFPRFLHAWPLQKCLHTIHNVLCVYCTCLRGLPFFEHEIF